MNASPIITWEGAEAYFTFADSPTAIGFFFIIGVLLTVGSIGYSMYHESEAYKKHMED